MSNKLINDAKEIADFIFQKLNQKLTQIETRNTNQKKIIESLKQEVIKMDKDLKSSTDGELASNATQEESISASIRSHILNKFLNPKPVEQSEPKNLVIEIEEDKVDALEVKNEDLEISSASPHLSPVKETANPSLEIDDSTPNDVKPKSSPTRTSMDKKLGEYG